jgi:hypothetical protein
MLDYMTHRVSISKVFLSKPSVPAPIKELKNGLMNKAH